LGRKGSSTAGGCAEKGRGSGGFLSEKKKKGGSRRDEAALQETNKAFRTEIPYMRKEAKIEGKRQLKGKRKNLKRGYLLNLRLQSRLQGSGKEKDGWMYQTYSKMYAMSCKR